MHKNVASQFVYFYAWNHLSDSEETGDAGNISVFVSLDGAAEDPSSNSVGEIDATNAPGVYALALTQGETNAGAICFSAISTTSGVIIMPIFVQTERVKRISIR